LRVDEEEFMADVKICDRCGKKIELRIWPVYIKHYRSILDMEDLDYNYTYDLCGSCNDKLFEFMKGDLDESNKSE
jgi:hypothetical protein